MYRFTSSISEVSDDDVGCYLNGHNQSLLINYKKNLINIF